MGTELMHGGIISGNPHECKTPITYYECFAMFVNFIGSLFLGNSKHAGSYSCYHLVEVLALED